MLYNNGTRDISRWRKRSELLKTLSTLQWRECNRKVMMCKACSCCCCCCCGCRRRCRCRCRCCCCCCSCSCCCCSCSCYCYCYCCMLNVVSAAAVTQAMFQNYPNYRIKTNLPFATSSCMCCSYSSYNYLEYVRISCNFPGPVKIPFPVRIG